LMTFSVVAIGSAGVGASTEVTTSVDTTPPTGDVEIDSALETSNDEEVQVIVRFNQHDRVAIEPTAAKTTLQQHAEATQKPLRTFSERTEGVEVENTFWIANAALVTVDTTTQSVDELAEIDGVTRLEANTIYEHPTPIEGSDNTVGDEEYTYGLEQINAPSVWNEFDARGEGVRVAALDTGIDADHDDLSLTDEGWADFDEDGNQVDEEPYDIDGHGTHVSGTIAGGNESGTHIGVAPDTELMHGKVFFEDGGQPVGSSASILAGMEWAVEEDADVLSMSLGSAVEDESIFDDTYVEPVENAREAGTAVVASSGNNGPELTGSPGNLYSSFSIAANDDEGEIAPFSSGEELSVEDDWNVSEDIADEMEYWPSQYLVPDVSGPGVDVVSTLPDDEYGANSGTSMSAPHVAGQLALLLEINPDLNLDQLEGTVAGTAVHPDGLNAEPDISFGQGIVDAQAAAEMVADDATIEGTVENDDGDPVERVVVDVEGGSSSETDGLGSYTVMTEAGEPAITVDGFGVEPINETFEVNEGETITEDLILEPDFDVEVASQPVTAIGIGETVATEFDVANAEEYELEIADTVGIDEAGLTPMIDGEEIEFGETVTFDDPHTDRVTVEVETNEETDEGELKLVHSVSGLEGEKEITTDGTDLIKDPDPAHFEIQTYDAPGVIEEDTIMDVEATIMNTGDLPSQESVVHWQLDPLLMSFAEPVELDPGESEDVGWAVSLEGFGTGQLPHGVFSETDDGIEKTTEVVDYDGIAVHGLEVPDTANEGEEIEVNATAERVGGDFEVDDDVELIFDGESIDETTVSLEGGESETVDFSFTLPDESDIYELTIQSSAAAVDDSIVVGDTVIEEVAVVDEPSDSTDGAVDRFDPSEALIAAGTTVLDPEAAEHASPYGGEDLAGVLDSALPANYVIDHVTTEDLETSIDEYDTFVVDNFDGDDALIESFFDETRAENQSVVMLDQWGPQSNAISDVSEATGNPVETDDADSLDGASPPVSYSVVPGQEDHDLFAGIDDVESGIIVHDAIYADMAWYSDYDGHTIAQVGASGTGDVGGESIGIDEDEREILLASLGFGGSMGSHYYSADAIEILTNAVSYEWEEEEDPAHFAVSIDDIDDTVDTGESLEINATVTNEGDETGSQEVALTIDGLEQETKTVADLTSGSSETVTFTYQTEDSDEGERSIGVASEDDTDSVDVMIGDAPEYPIMLGDVLEDGDVGLADVLAIQSYSIGIGDETVEAERADLNRDGDVGLADVMLAQEKSVGTLEGADVLIDGFDDPGEVNDDEVTDISVDVENEGDLGAIDQATLGVVTEGDDLSEATTVDQTELDLGIGDSRTTSLELDASEFETGSYELVVETSDSTETADLTIESAT